MDNTNGKYTEEQFNAKFQEVRDRLDKKEIEEFYHYWELNFIIKLDELIDEIAKIIADMWLDEEADGDGYICVGRNDRYDIDISLDKTSGDCWMYPVAYGKRIDTHMQMILEGKPKRKFSFDKSKVDEDAILGFTQQYQIKDTIKANTIIGWIEEDLEDCDEWPEDTWHQHTFTMPERDD